MAPVQSQYTSIHPRPRLLSLQVGRGLAALVVVLFHARGFAGGSSLPFAGGHMAVIFFFILSGFIIYYAHCKDVGHPCELKRYAFRRFARLYPLYWAVALVLIPVLALSPSVAAHSHNFDFISLSKSLLLLPTQNPEVVGATWSLQYEVVFYALFGLAILNSRLLILFPIWTAAVFCGFFVHHKTFATAFILSPMNLNFMEGMLAAMAFDRYRSHVTIARAASLVGGIVTALAYALVINNVLIGKSYLLFGLASAISIWGLATADAAGGFSPWSAFTLLGDASYAIYLIHYPVIAFLARLIGKGVWKMWILAAISTAAGIALHRVVELPLTSAIRRLPHQSAGHGAPATAE